jgi:hypothetical protein
MAKISAHGEPFAIVLAAGGIVAFMPDGVTLRRTPERPWKVFRRLKAGHSLPDWRAKKERRLADWQTKEPWRFGHKSIPSMRTLETWLREDGTCETPSGDVVEPDGTGPDGAPSWLRYFSLI